MLLILTLITEQINPEGLNKAKHPSLIGFAMFAQNALFIRVYLRKTLKLGFTSLPE